MAVKPSHQRMGYGRILMAAAETLLRQKGCPKINLQVRNTNKAAIEFYAAIGYDDDHVIGLGKRLTR
nr:GNAT family N-acetyltransferase [uncultured Halomonas sp.]